MSSAQAERIAATLALPFAAPHAMNWLPGQSIQAALDAAMARGIIDPAYAGALRVFVGDVEIPQALWARVKPKPGAIVGVRAQVRDLGSILTIAWTAIQNIAIAYAVNAVLGAFTSDPSPMAAEQIHSIANSRNQFVRYEPVSAVLGAFRVFPRHAAKPYTRAEGEKVFLYLLLNLGLGPVAFDEPKIGDTPLDDFTGVTSQLKLSPDDPWPTLYPRQADEEEGPGLIANAGGWIQRTTSTANADELEVEITFPRGLIYYKADGDTRAGKAHYRIRYRAEGSDVWLDWATGAPNANGTLYENTFRATKPFRQTKTRQVARGTRYEIAVKRDNEDYDYPNALNQFHWTRLRTFTNDPPVTDPNAALWALKIEAGDQLNGVVDEVNCLLSRIAPKWDSEAEAFGAADVSANPAELVNWIATGPGAARPRDQAQEIDVAAFGAWAELCTLKDWRCDMELRAGAPQEEIMAMVAKCGRAVLGERAGKLTPIVDAEEDVAAQLFTARNSWGLRARRRFRREVHAHRLEFNNAAKGHVQDEMLVCFPGYTEETASLIERRATPGKTRGVEVYREGKRAIAEEIIRGEDYVWNADIENLTIARGKRVKLAHFSIAVGRKSVRVTGRVLNEGGTHVLALETDEWIEQTLGESYGIEWRRIEDDAMSCERLGVTTTPGVSMTIELAAEGGVPIDSAPAEGDLIEFGDAEIETLDLTVQSISRANDFEAEISALAYSGALMEDDGAEEPEWQSNVSGAAFPAPPAPEIRGIAPAPTGIFVDYDFPLGAAQRVQAVEAYWRPLADASTRYELAQTLGALDRLAAFPAGVAGSRYAIKLVAVGERGRRTESVAHEVESGAFTLPFTGALTQASYIVTTAPDGSGGAYGPAGGTFRVKLGDTDVTTGAGVVYSVIETTGGLQVSIDADTGVFAVTTLAGDVGTARFLAQLGERAVDVDYSIAKSKTGLPGQPGDPVSGFVASIDIDASDVGVNLRDLANAAGYTGLGNATITYVVKAGTFVRGRAGAINGGAGIDTGEWPGEHTIALTLEIEADGGVDGGGGRHGLASTGFQPGGAGGKGGPGIFMRRALDVIVEGALMGGGGGGGGGGGLRQRIEEPQLPWSSEVADADDLPNLRGDTLGYSGGPGGGGFPNGAGGAPDGEDGDPMGGGAGGEGFSVLVGTRRTGDGGNGGDAGQAGQAGDAASGTGGVLFTASPPGAGGAAGLAIQTNGFSLSLSGGGDIVGDVV